MYSKKRLRYCSVPAPRRFTRTAGEGRTRSVDLATEKDRVALTAVHAPKGTRDSRPPPGGLSIYPSVPHPRAAYLEVRVISTAGTKSMKRDLYTEVTARIVAELEAGAPPWIRPWSATAGTNTPCNASTNRPYSGCNVVLLWMAQAAGYRTPL
jgi:N-terminal domain of anti-restriction factor ArdC